MKSLSSFYFLGLVLLCASCVEFKTETKVSYLKTQVTESTTADGKTQRTVSTTGFSGSNPGEVINSVTVDYVKEEVGQLDDQQALGRIAQSDPDPDKRISAISKLTFQPTLGSIAQKDKDPEVRKAAIRKLTFTPTLNRSVADEQDPEVRQVAREVLEAL